MFLGSEFCGRCGAKAVQAELADGDSGDCPRCKRQLDLLRISEIALNECQKCGGMWMNVETFRNICTDREKQLSILGFSSKHGKSVSSTAKISYVPCPQCKQLMNRSNFARASGVMIDTCKDHGVWFDAEELPKIIEFIQKGGMERAREKEKIELKDERDRLRDERRKQAAFDARWGTADGDREEARGIQGFLSRLFDI